MVHLDRIFEEIRVLNVKDESLLSFRVFENFSKRIQHFNTIKMGLFPERNLLTDDELEEIRCLDVYFKTLQHNFSDIFVKWHRRIF
mgnify:CR=1 FL=1|jgi:hypothetical protein